MSNSIDVSIPGYGDEMEGLMPGSRDSDEGWELESWLDSNLPHITQVWFDSGPILEDVKDGDVDILQFKFPSYDIELVHNE